MAKDVSPMTKEPPVERALLIWYTAKGKKRMFIVPIDRNKRFMLMDIGDRFLDDKHLKKDVISKLKTVRRALAKPKENESHKKKSKSKSSKKKVEDLDFNEISNEAMKKAGKKEKQEKDKKKEHKNDTKEEMSQKLIELSKEDINTRGIWFKHRIKNTKTLMLRDVPINMVVICGSSRPE